MGGAQSVLFGLNALDRFQWIGAFSSGGLDRLDFEKEFPDLTGKSKMRLLWIGCGKEDGLFKSNQKFNEWLTTKGVEHTWVEVPGQHSFLVWRRFFAEFAPLLFREK